MSVAAALPHWDLTPYFPSLDSPEFAAAFEELNGSLATLEALAAANGVGALASGSAPIDPPAFESVLDALNDVLRRYRLLYAYVNCHIDTDSKDELAAATMSKLDEARVRLAKLRTRFTAWIGSTDVQDLAARSAKAASHRYALEKAWTAARHQMGAAEEELAAELATTGSVAWEKLYGKVTSEIQVPVALPSGETTLPMSAVRNLAHDRNPAVRAAAYEAELHAWQAHEAPIAAALNSLKGEFLTLCGRRGWNDPLDVSLFHANIDRATLEAMMAAARASFPAFRRYLRAKAKRLGYAGGLPWHGLFAPVVEGGASVWDYDKASRFIVESFEGYSGGLAQFADRALRENWVDAEPRPGKADGGYCTGTREGESRIFMNYKPAFGSVGTLAHELGHAYHNWMLRERTPLQMQTPMTLAETASIFCETLIRKRGIEQGGEEERLAILEASLMGSCQVVVDITSRYRFEAATFDKRRERELSPKELSELMRQAQIETYGDGLDAEILHPYMWAAKPHYYSGSSSFYNYPYMFGLLFGLGLYGLYQNEPDGFIDRYDDLLSSTGLADAATCAGWFGIDIRSSEFWAGSLSVIEEDIDAFCRLVG